MLSWSTLIADCTNPGHSLSLMLVIHTVGLDIVFEHSLPQRFLCFFFRNSVQENDIRTKAHDCYFSELLPLSESEESIKNKSQKIGMFQKPKFPKKDKVFEET